MRLETYGFSEVIIDATELNSIQLILKMKETAIIVLHV